MKLDLKLKSVTLENFRLFEKLEMDFHPQVTVLIGENGAGKTALVEGIAKMLTPLPKLIEKIQNLTQEEKDTTRKNIFKKKDITIGKEALSASISINYSGNDETLVVETPKMDRENIASLFNQVQFTGINYLSEFRQARSAGIVNATPILVYYRCDKTDDIIQNGQLEGIEGSNIFSTYDNALNGKTIDFKSFLEWYKWQEDKKLRGIGTSTLKVVKAGILSTLNDKEDDDKFTDLFIDVSVLNDYRLKVVKRTTELDFDQLSSGEQSLLALVADMARRIAIANPENADPLQEGGGIVIIDEIDLHLHPRWQRKIVRKLTEIFPKVQFIITTHSPLILGSVRSENIRLLDDGQVFSVPETLGQSVGVIIKRIMGVEESLFESEIGHIFKLLAKNNIEEAKGEIAAIEEKSPADIPSLREAKAILKRKEMPAA
jgi:predicted ATP-binding protein involved in virulence